MPFAPGLWAAAFSSLIGIVQLILAVLGLGFLLVLAVQYLRALLGW